MSNHNVQTEDEKLEYEELSLGINDLDTNISFDAVYDALKELPGIRAMRAMQGGVMISYNPLGVTQQEICTEIERAGFTIDNVESGHHSPQYPNPQPKKEPLDHMGPIPKTHDDPGGHKGQ